MQPIKVLLYLAEPLPPDDEGDDENGDDEKN